MSPTSTAQVPAAIPMPLAAGADARSFPLVSQLFAKHGYANVNDANFSDFVGQPGHTLLMFLEDPFRFKESLDLAVIVPELVRAFPLRFAVGVLLPEAARVFQPRYGFRRWPALVMLRDSQYVGAVDGLRNWDEYVGLVGELLEAAPVRAPTVGIPVKGAGEAGAACGN